MRKFTTAVLTALLSLGMSLSAQTYSKALEKQAKDGDAKAMVELADAYAAGNGTAKDVKKAEKWYKNAIKADNPDGYVGMSNLYTSWDGIEKNAKKAQEWLAKGAEAGAPDIAHNFGLSYFNGEEGYGRNLSRAYHYLTKALKNGSTASEPYIYYINAVDDDNINYFAAIEYADKVLAGEIQTSDEGKTLAKAARNIAYAALGQHYKVDFSDSDNKEEIFYCTALRLFDLPDLYTEDQIEDEIRKYAGKIYGSPASYYIAGLAKYAKKNYIDAAKLFAKAYERGYENGGVAMMMLRLYAVPSNYTRQNDPLNINMPVQNITLQRIENNKENSNRYNQQQINTVVRPFVEKIKASSNPEYLVKFGSKELRRNIISDWAKKGLASAIKAETIARRLEVDKFNRNKLSNVPNKPYQNFSEVVMDLGVMEKMANRGDGWAVKEMFSRAIKSNNPEKIELWTNRLHLRFPSFSTSSVSNLYESYKAFGESGPMILVDKICEENPEYVYNWVVSEPEGVSKSECVNVLRQTAEKAKPELRQKITNLLKTKYNTKL